MVGDDDQSIYRFRGASVANMLEFPRRFPGCRVLGLTTNYRSHRDIVAACGQWMDTAAPWEADGRSYRYAKSILPQEPEAHPGLPCRHLGGRAGTRRTSQPSWLSCSGF